MNNLPIPTISKITGLAEKFLIKLKKDVDRAKSQPRSMSDILDKYLKEIMV